MIKKGTNILKEHAKNNLKFEAELKQINFLDTRCYQRDKETYYPSVTTILQYIPKNKYFEEWLKDVGHNADFIKEQAGYEGTQVHEAAEALLKGEEVEWMDNFGNAKYSFPVWKMILKFADFWKTYQPTLLLSERIVYSDKYKFAGTVDLVVELEGEKWLLDIKTSKNLHKSHSLQLASYAKALEEVSGIKVDRTGILWLKAHTKKSSKKEGIIQGSGWQLKAIDDVEKNFKLFLYLYEFYKEDHLTTVPLYKTYSTSIKL